jgi:excisionase family DNA binding protein
MDEYFTRQEACQLLRCSLSMFERLVREGAFPVIKLQRKVLVKRAVLEAWLDAHETTATADRHEGQPAPDRLGRALASARSPQASLALEERAEQDA